MAHLCATSVIPSVAMGGLIAHQAMWLSGRALFLSGYSTVNPVGRELGFDLTIMSSISVILVSLFYWIY